ncbi:MAG: DUF2846 domain-containing protein [Candidatus Nitrotoga sp.]
MTPVENLVENSSYKWIGAVLGASFVLLLSACASSPGEKFAGVAPLDAKYGDLYLYQTKNSTGTARENGEYEVVLNGKKVGALYNASFLHLRIPPGRYTLQVYPAHHAREGYESIEVQAGKVTYYRYQFFPDHLRQNVSRYRSLIQFKAADEAVSELKDLNSATN